MKKRSKPAAAKPVLVTAEPGSFFKEQVGKAFEHQKISAQPGTRDYVVDLLIRFMLAENLYAVDANGVKHQETLAVLLSDTLGSGNPGQQRQNFRRIGDVSLYTAGFFGDSLARKIVDIDYYIGMGKSAYRSLAGMGFAQRVFAELAEKFTQLVDALGEISAAAGTNDPRNILRTYEMWLKTRSERAEKSLKEAGIFPTRGVKPGWQ